MKTKKSGLAKLWAPALAIAAAALCSLALSGCIQAAERAADAEAAAEPLPPAAMDSVPASAPAEPSAAEAPDVYEEGGYRVVDVLDELSPSPTAADLDCKAAAAIAADMLVRAYGVELSGQALYCQYGKYEGMANGRYAVLLGGSSYASASHVCFMEAVTGEVLMVERVFSLADGAEKNASFEVYGEGLDEALRGDAALLEAARDAAERIAGDGREVAELSYVGMEWDFSHREIDAKAEVLARFSDGEAWRLLMAYPGYELICLHKELS